MTKLAFPLSIAAAMCLVAMFSTSAQALLIHTWVASNGDDTHTCDRSAPCATFEGAYNKTAAGGEITCVDSGNYGGLNIHKSITINCPNAIGSIETGTTVFALVINTVATDVVTLRGLDLMGRA